MVDDGPATLAAGVVTTLAVPFQVPLRLLRARSEVRRAGDAPRPLWSLALIWLAFVPIVVAYEALALPLVAGTVAFCIVLIAVPAVIGRVVRALWRLVRRGVVAEVPAVVEPVPSLAVHK